MGHTDLIANDPDPVAQAIVREQFGLSCCSSSEEVWQTKPNVALVTSPAPSHISLAREAVAQGCHVFIEKPLANSLRDVDDLLDEVHRANVISMVGCNMRFHPGPSAIQALVAAGRIGNVLSARLETGSYLPTWRPSLDYRKSISARSEMGGGVLLECIHEIDLSLWLFGPGTLVGAATKRADSLGIDVEGLAELLIRHDSDVLSSIHLNFLQPNYHRTCHVIGTDGALFWDFAKPWVELRNSTVEHIPLDDTWKVNAMYREELAEFLDCVRSGRQTLCTIADGRRALEIALVARTFAEGAGQHAAKQ
jgi:predicted dehydrogenase